MKTLLLCACLALVVPVMPACAEPAASHAADFDAFLVRFHAAVKANDAQKIADLIAFPVADWAVESKGNVQEGPISDRADFLVRYQQLFTASMRAHAASGKPLPLKDGRYVLIWDDADAEFSFEFAYVAGAGYRVSSYSIGPR